MGHKLISQSQSLFTLTALKYYVLVANMKGVAMKAPGAFLLVLVRGRPVMIWGWGWRKSRKKVHQVLLLA